MKRILRVIADNPIESIMFVFSVGLFLSAVYIATPWYISAPSPLGQALAQRIAEYISAVVLMSCAVPGVLAMRQKNRTAKSTKLLKMGSSAIFMCFLFLVLIRILVVGIVPITWLPLLMISLCSGIIRLYLGRLKI